MFVYKRNCHEMNSGIFLDLDDFFIVLLAVIKKIAF